MLRIKCPHCEHALQIQSPKVGRFKPTCSGCKQPFVLVIDEHDGQTRARTGKPKPPVHDSTRLDTSPAESVETDSPAAVTKPALDGEQTLPFGSLGTQATQGLEEKPPIKEQATTGFSFDTVAAKTNKVLEGHDPSSPILVGSQAKTAVASQVPAGASKATSGSGAEASSSLVPSGRLGGYRIVRALGSGGMGAVFLAKQLSLDRNVALKTIQARWASNPRAIARFVREAYAAAQLTHHNVAQIYDLGQDHDTNFFSMELVDGGSLDELLTKHKHLPPQRAAALIVQAARGLQFAHDHGMVHRDIKPANMMLTKEGVLKICDLGLVKTPDYVESDATNDADKNVLLASARSQVTGMGSTMGTPAYMAPEQAQDAASVDHRADIYALGCTFFALLTGKPPFSEGTALEIISKKATESIPREPLAMHDVPNELAAIVERMTATKPDQRYQSLSDCIHDLEAYIAGLEPSASGVPSSQHVDRLEAVVEQLTAAGLSKMHALLPPIYLLAVGLLFVMGVWLSWKVGLSVLLFGLLTPPLVSLISGMAGGESPVGSRLRSLLLTSSWSDWLMWCVALLISALVAWVTGLVGSLLIAVLLAAGVAAGYYFGIVKPLRMQREPALKDARRLLKELRMGGMPEEKLRSFVAEQAEGEWELLYESLFGYDALRDARRTLKERGLLVGKKRRQPWRDMIVDRLEAIVDARRQKDAQQVLSNIECKGLVAEGVSPAEAKSQALARAVTLVDVASQVRQSQNMHVAGETPEQKRLRIKRMLASARSGAIKPSMAGRASSQLLTWLLGGRTRFVVGSLMIAGCALWMRQNDLFNPQSLQQAQTMATDLASTASDLASTAQSAIAGDREQAAKHAADKQEELVAASSELKSTVNKMASSLGNTQPLNVPVIGRLFDSSASGIIGLLILASCVLSGWRYSLFALPAAAITLLGAHVGIPSLGFQQGAQWLSAALGLGILLMGLLFGRSPKH
ncbi:MAG: serine/threonine protein kinase [Pirellulaceae bacterium]|jgi:serine/threonine protein kinase|nr:serine/threonine protein kinase [Pirellulaceae bacterium]